jgi:hypothetical protein
MPILGAGLHVLLASLLVIHAVRTHRPGPWPFVVFALPVLGALAYLWHLRRGGRSGRWGAGSLPRTLAAAGAARSPRGRRAAA